MQENLGLKTYEYTNHLGNVLLTTNDKRLPIDNNTDNVIDAYSADVRSYSDYYPYGMLMVGRNSNISDYRFGYQGSEMDNEHKGNGNSYTTYFRQHDPRLGRWFAVDPVTQPWQSPYTSMDCNPIMTNDPLGDLAEEKVKNQDGTFTKVSEKGNEDGVDIVYSGGQWTEGGGYVGGTSEVVDQIGSGKAPATSIAVQNPQVGQDKTMVNVASERGGLSYANPRDFTDNLARSGELVYKSVELSLFRLKQDYFFDGSGTIRPNDYLAGRQVRNGITSNGSLNAASKTIARGGYVFDAVLILSDVVDVSQSIDQQTRDKNLKILVLDGSGLVVGYVSPLTGAILSFGAVVTQTDDYKRVAALGWKQEMQKIRNLYKDDINPALYMEDPRYIQYLDKYHEFCGCKPVGIRQTVVRSAD